MADIPEELKEKINKLSMLEQSLQQFLVKKQTFQGQLIEVESALEALGSTDKAYKIIANVMVSAKKEDLIKELESKKETVNLRIKSLEKQEEKVRQQTTELQSEVMKKMRA